ncbi:hypothetical protein AKJ41_04325 [candidate division MSBL1 archaeon SCGC-AAA259O05]|uniref:Uncharacterized protein n=1 Tax=candidate division MSBL1 archaeon SCGC-AAA259O05 TaxID=1698271 RepID=A0A133V125_9EURY|nr:hypothetical protein AKJ41_04325 [candidate division MSBL1 archaeon SCGC-AAA259O05]
MRDDLILEVPRDFERGQLLGFIVVDREETRGNLQTDGGNVVAPPSEEPHTVHVVGVCGRSEFCGVYRFVRFDA